MASSSSLMEVDGRQLLFSGPQQQLFDLNPTAAVLARRLCDKRPASFNDLVSGLQDLGFEPLDAAEAARSMLAAWSQAQVVDFDLPHDHGFPLTQPIALGPERIDIHYDGPELSALVAPSFDHLARAGMPAMHHWRLAQSDGLVVIESDSRKPVALEPRQATPALKAWMLEDLLRASTDFTALHAACLVHGGKALLLLGSPGAGKSTLAARLDRAGFQFGGDDLCFLGHDGRVRGAPFALTAKTGSWPLLAPFRPDVMEHRVHLRLDGKQVRYLPPLAPLMATAVPIGWTILLRREDDAPATLVERHRADALADLLGEAFSRQNHARIEDLRMVLDALGEARCLELRYSSLEDAADKLAALCGLG